MPSPALCDHHKVMEYLFNLLYSDYTVSDMLLQLIQDL